MRIKNLVAAAILVAAVFAVEGKANSCSVCKCGDNSYFARGQQTLARGQWLFAVEDFMLQKVAAHPVLLNGTSHHDPESDEPEAHGHGDAEIQDLTQHTIQAMIFYGVSDRLTALISIPYTANRITEEEGTLDVRGLSDPQLELFYQAWSGNTSALLLSAGVRLPLGKDNARGPGGHVVDSHEQPGTGAYATLVGLAVQQQFGAWPMYASLQGQVNFQNRAGYRYGHVLRYNVGTQRHAFGRVKVIAELNGRTAARDHQDGLSLEHTGGTAIYFSPGVLVPLASNGPSLRLQVQVPVVEDLVGIQDEGVNFRGGVIWSL